MADHSNKLGVFESPLDKYFNKLAKGLVPYVPASITPNQITAISIIISLIGGLFFYLAGINRFFFFGAIAAMLLHLVLDFLDGALARARGMASNAGAFLDFFSDIVVIMFIFIGIGFSNYASFEIMAFPIILYATHSVILQASIIYLDKVDNPGLGDCEMFLSLSILSLIMFFLNGQQLEVMGIEFHLFDGVGIILSIVSFVEQGVKSTVLFKELKKAEEIS